MASHPPPKLATSAVVLALLCGLALGALVVALVIPDRTPTALAASATLTSAAVEEQQYSDQRSVKAALETGLPTSLIGNANGRVTAVSQPADDAILSGSSPLSVDEVPVLALHTTVSLYRDLGIGSRGSDVKALQQELRRLGYDVEADGNYGSGTSNAVKQLKGKNGFNNPTGDLPLAQTLWLPAESVTGAEWTAQLGAQVVAGEAYATVPGRLIGVQVVMPSDLDPGDRKLTLFGVSASVGANGDIAAPKFLRAVEKTLDYEVAAAAGNGEPVTAELSLADPVAALRVPPTALFGLDGDLACLQSGDVTYPVKLVGSAMGASLITIDSEDNSIPPPATVALGDAITASGCR